MQRTAASAAYAASPATAPDFPEYKSYAARLLCGVAFVLGRILCVDDQRFAAVQFAFHAGASSEMTDARYGWSIAREKEECQDLPEST